MEVQPNGISQWAFEDTVVTGRMTIDKPSAKLLAAVAAGEAHGDLKVRASQDERSRMSKAVESDADSLKAQAKAMEDGSWQRGNAEAQLVHAQRMLEQDDLSDETRAANEAIVASAEAFLNEDTDG